LDTAVFGAVCNVRVNLSQIKDPSYVTKMEEEAQTAINTATKGCNEVLSALEARNEG